MIEHQKTSVIAGIALIGVGILLWLELGWMILPLLLAALGAFFYTQRRGLGQTASAVQSLLWGVGLAILFAFEVLFPGLLLLIGGSLLLRGREEQVDQKIQNFVATIRARRSAAPKTTAIQHIRVEPTTVPPTPTVYNPQVTQNNIPVTNDTVRLKD
jgi:predicted membrane protein